MREGEAALMMTLLERKRVEEKSAMMRSYRPFIVLLTVRILWSGWGMMVRNSGNAGGAVKFLPPNMPRALSAMSLRFKRMILRLQDGDSRDLSQKIFRFVQSLNGVSDSKEAFIRVCRRVSGNATERSCRESTAEARSTWRGKFAPIFVCYTRLK
jgi:hypothetical protein